MTEYYDKKGNKIIVGADGSRVRIKKLSPEVIDLLTEYSWETIPLEELEKLSLEDLESFLNNTR